jgi:tetratricopeptide (TPR) repeat protein
MPWPNRRLRLALGLVTLLALVGYLGGRQAWAEYHLRAGRRCLAHLDFRGALGHLRRCLAVRADDADLHFLAGQAARRAGLVDEAPDFYDACARLRGETEALTLERSLLLAQRGELTPDLEQKLGAAVLDGRPERHLILEALAQGYIQTYQLPRAMACLDGWLAQQPDAVAALYWRGWVNEGLRRPEQAAADYRRVLELDPEHDDTRLHLGLVLVYTESLAEAAGHLELVLQRQPDNPKALLGLARVRRKSDRLGEAEDLLERLLRDHPDDADALRERGRVAQAAGRDGDAEGWFRRSEAVDPYDQETLFLLYLCLAQAGRRDEAEAYRARFRQAENDLNRLAELTSLVAARPDDAGLRYEAGLICRRNGQAEEAVRWLTGALQVDPGHGPSRRALAELRGQGGR